MKFDISLLISIEPHFELNLLKLGKLIFYFWGFDRNTIGYFREEEYIQEVADLIIDFIGQENVIMSSQFIVYSRMSFFSRIPKSIRASLPFVIVILEDLLIN